MTHSGIFQADAIILCLFVHGHSGGILTSSCGVGGGRGLRRVPLAWPLWVGLLLSTRAFRILDSSGNEHTNYSIFFFSEKQRNRSGFGRRARKEHPFGRGGEETRRRGRLFVTRGKGERAFCLRAQAKAARQEGASAAGPERRGEEGKEGSGGGEGGGG